MELSFVQTSKLALVAVTGLSKDSLHVYTGMAVFLLAMLVRRSPRVLLPWVAVVLVAVLGEMLDRRDDLASLGHWRWEASLHDVLNTVFWPTVLSLLFWLRWWPASKGETDESEKR